MIFKADVPCPRCWLGTLSVLCERDASGHVRVLDLADQVDCAWNGETRDDFRFPHEITEDDLWGIECAEQARLTLAEEEQ